ncbi:MAG: hypothetical protein SGILL_001664 [Bacillariaceae sp.]
MAKSSNVRQRRKVNQSKEKEGGKGKSDKDFSNNTEHEENKDPSLSSVFFNHPLVRVGQFILLPYLLFQAFNYVTLKKPEWLGLATGGWINLRPSVGTYDERQVLIVGASINDNKQLASKLSSTLQLEISHETFDSLHNYCRDGTVSWYQFMRFLSFADNGKNNEKKGFHQDSTAMSLNKVQAFKELCVDRNSSLVSQFFHPRDYAPSQVCSSRELWSNCWSNECILTLQAQWDCQNGKDDGANHDNQRESYCKPSFGKVLHQTRFPLTTIEQLNNTYCDIDGIKGSFLNIVSGFFPHRDWQDMPCLEAVSWYTLDFESTMLQARKDGDVVDGIFKLESTSPCEVASLAGFTDPTHSLYHPHLERLTTLCHESEDKQLDKKTQQKAETARSKHAFVPRVPKSLQQKTATWDELEQELKTVSKNGKRRLIDSLKDLSKELGYGEGSNVNEDEEFS